MKKVISTTKAPSAIGPYSQAIQVGNLILKIVLFCEKRINSSGKVSVFI